MSTQDGNRGMMEREVLSDVENVICLVGPVGMRGATRYGIEPSAFVVGDYNAHTGAAYRTRFTSDQGSPALRGKIRSHRLILYFYIGARMGRRSLHSIPLSHASFPRLDGR